MIEYTTWVAIKLARHSGITDEFYEHLAMNGYTYDVAISNSGLSTLFVSEDEFDYVITMLDDREILYEVI